MGEGSRRVHGFGGKSPIDRQFSGLSKSYIFPLSEDSARQQWRTKILPKVIKIIKIIKHCNWSLCEVLPGLTTHHAKYCDEHLS